MKEGKCLRLEDIKSPQDIKGLSYAEMNDLAAQIRTELVTTISKRGGHLASNLGVVELTMATACSTCRRTKSSSMWGIRATSISC